MKIDTLKFVGWLVALISGVFNALWVYDSVAGWERWLSAGGSGLSVAMVLWFGPGAGRTIAEWRNRRSRR